MKKFNQHNRSDRIKGSHWGQKRRNFDDRHGSRSPLHRATCSNCGKPCEVPFKPTGDRPVYCADCFAKLGKKPPERGNKNFTARNFEPKKQLFETTCSNCGKPCEVPFKPTGDRPVYCADCFEKMHTASGKPSNAADQHFSQLNAKLDQIIVTLNKLTTTPTPATKKATKKVTTKKSAAKKAKPKKKKSL